MKVIHVLLGRPAPESMNGVNKAVHQLATHQARLGWQVEVWALTHSTRTEQHTGYITRYFAPSRWRFALPSDLRRCLAGLASGRTLFHLHSVFLPEFFVISRSLRSAGIPWVLSPHGGYASLLHKPSLAKTLYARSFERYVTDQAAAIHVLGPYGEREHLSRIAKMRAVEIPNGQDPARSLERTYNSGAGLRLVFCGRLAALQKGLDRLLDGLAKARLAGCDVSLDLIGDGEDRQSLERTCRERGLDRIVRFHGALFGSEKLRVLLEGDVFVHVSRWEGLPTAALEAAASGLPLLISRETNLGAFVSQSGAGIVLNETNPDSISRAIYELAEIKIRNALSRLGSAARAGVDRSFDWSEVARRHLDTYRTVVN